jgi:ArpU family phage transcriptional regulator
MNYIREAAMYLENYENLLIARKHLKEKVLELKENLTAIKGVSYSDLPKGKAIAPDDSMANMIFELDTSIKLFEENEEALKDIEKSLEDLPEESKRIIWLWYVEEKTETQMLSELNISRSTFYRLKSQAIRTFAVQLFGVRAVL